MNFYPPFSSIPVTSDYQRLLNQTTNLPSKIPSWFRKPARVTKHASRDNSPRSLVRRRTTASARTPSRHNSITDGRYHQKHFSTPNGLASFEGRARPMSWHSTGFEQTDSQFLPSYSQFPTNMPPSSYFLGPSSTTCEVNGAITPVSHPFAGEPFVQDAFTPLDDMSSQDFDRRYAFLNEFSADKEVFYQSQYGSQYPVTMDSLYQFPDGLYEGQKQPEYHFQQPGETAPPTPDSVPFQPSTELHGDGFTAGADQETEDLVGMGLYDAPSPLPTSTMFLSDPWDIPFRPALGKGLKLEETFQPTTTDDDDEEDEAASAEDGDGEEDQQEEEAARSDEAELPYFGLDDKGFYNGQEIPTNSNFMPDYTNQEDAWWSTDAVTNQSWV